MEEIKVTFRTLTPLWTGDAWGENSEIKASSIIGSLRFWFEVICYFSGITNKTNYEDKGKELLKDNIEYVKFREKILESGTNFDSVDKALAELGITLPSRIFGCTGWKSLIRIKSSTIASNGTRYSYPIGKIDYPELKYKNPKDDKKVIIPKWYFPKGFMGEFEIVFKLNEHIVKPIFYPLLHFIEKYGFLGGKWNVGYGRVKIESAKSKQKKNEYNEGKEFLFEKFYKYGDILSKFKNVSQKDFIEEVYNFNDLINKKSKKILLLKNKSDGDIKSIIRELIKQKAEERIKMRSNDDKRHRIFGEGGKNAQGTKIIPWIYEENNELKGGFISIAGFLSPNNKGNGQKT